MQQVRPDPGGFSSGNYGVAFVLAGNNTSAATLGDGWAVVLGQSGTVDPIRLARYTGGIQGTLTNVITASSVLNDVGAEYLSLEVQYNALTNTWSLFGRNDGASAFADPSVGTLSSLGTATDSTHVTTSMSFMGAYWQGSTAASQNSKFDNVSVIVTLGSYWDTNGSTAGVGGTGTWTTSSHNFATSVAGTLVSAYDPSHTIIFDGTSGTVTVSGTVAPQAGMTFNTTGYTLTGGTIQLAGASPAANTITTDVGVTSTIESTLTGSNGLTKSGSGTLNLGGSNSYSGTTTVSNGRLNVNGTHTGGGTYTVNSAGTLGGTGTVNSTVNVAGKLAPGTSVGTFTLRDGSISGTLEIEMNSPDSATLPTADKVVVTGASGLSVSGATLNMASLGSAAAYFDVGGAGHNVNGISYTLVDQASGAPVSGAFATLVGGTGSVSEGGVFTALNAQWQITYMGGASSNDIVITTVPEPTCVTLLALAGASLFRRRRVR